MKSAPRIAGSGLFALDLVLSPSGDLVSTALGGSAGNVLAILARLGWESTPIARLGDDRAGQRLSEEFSALHADLRFFCRAPGHSTPVIYQHLLGHGTGATHRFSFTCPMCGRKRNPPRISTIGAEIDHVVSSTPADVYFFDRPTKEAVELAEQFRLKGVVVMFEPSALGDDKALFRRALAASHIVKYADDRLRDLAQYSTSAVDVEICTMGVKGLSFRAPSLDRGWMQLDAFSATHVIDTSGAGDWCTAGMLFRLFRAETPFHVNHLNYNLLSQALLFGQALSTLNCMTPGARGLARVLTPAKITQSGNFLKQTRGERGAVRTDARAEKALALFVDEMADQDISTLAKASRLGENEVLCCDALFC